jgi:hypothetical protein
VTERDGVMHRRSVWRILAGALAALAGAIACAAGCMALPVVAAMFSAAGIGFVRIHGLQILLAALSIALILRGFGDRRATARCRDRARPNGSVPITTMRRAK